MDVIATAVFATKLATIGDKNDPFQKYAADMLSSFHGFAAWLFSKLYTNCTNGY